MDLLIAISTACLIVAPLYACAPLVEAWVRKHGD